jgi:hypothetical protein
MHVVAILSRWLLDFTVIEHRARALALMKVVQALVSGGKLCLTHLGRFRAGPARVKHHIKAVDRLLGNRHLHAEREDIYRAIAHTLLRDSRRPTIIVDWSDFELHRDWVLLKAAVATEGRAVTIYEKVFPFKRYNSPGAHREFLKELAATLPPNTNPVVVTDAGFRGPWFRDVEALGWDWVGRIRNKIKYFNEATGRWCFTDSLYKQATPRVAHIGQVNLARRGTYRCHLYLVRAYEQRRGRRPKRRRRRVGNIRMYRRLHRAPWLLATSLPHTKHSHRRVRALYSQRMQIEETFRDSKNLRWGFGLRFARCGTAERLGMLVLIAALAALVQWLCGLHARASGLARQFQANTEWRKPVLSTVFLGQQVIQRQISITWQQHVAALSVLQSMIAIGSEL